MSFHAQNGPTVKRLSQGAAWALLCFLCAFALSGCGKRPSQVDPPDGALGQARVYPDPATDPSP